MNNYSIRYLITAFAVALLFLVLMVMLAQAQTNLVADGSFEATPIGEYQFTSAWSLVAGSDGNSDYGVATATGGYELAEQGTNYAYFRGHPTDNSQDCLGQYVTLTVGALYHISYWEGTDGPLTNGAAMYAQIGADYGLSSSDVPLPPFFPHSATALPYQEFSTNWIANSDYPILSFHGVNATNGLAVTNSILLDNVSMVLAYPPLKPAYSKPNSLVFTWPFTNSPYRLQSCTSLLSANWTTLTNVPVNVGSSNNQITLTLSTNSAVFYRLTLP
ncbi:MAG TPA: hypothetical protein VNU95_11075 [Candidatus Acidoferrales bacterium]|jgi:hypothetical protein|nr:hypothetical protein [Candidatus Acidoferrales bacterium]